MISVSGKKWREKKNNIRLVKKVQQDNNFSRIVSQLIVSRSFDNNESFQSHPGINIKSVNMKGKRGKKLKILHEFDERDQTGSNDDNEFIRFNKDGTSPIATVNSPDRNTD